MIEIFTSHDDVGSVAAYTLVVNWHAVMVFVTETVPVALASFLAWWLPLNVALATLLYVSSEFQSYARVCRNRVLYPHKRFGIKRPMPFPFIAWALFCVSSVPVFLLVTLKRIVAALIEAWEHRFQRTMHTWTYKVEI